MKTGALIEQAGGSVRAQAGNEERLVPGSLAADKLNGGTRDGKRFGDKLHQRRVGSGIDWRSGQRYFQFVSVQALDAIAGSSRLQFHGQVNSILGFTQEWNAHGMGL